jgi:hypothetical protein
MCGNVAATSLSAQSFALIWGAAHIPAVPGSPLGQRDLLRAAREALDGGAPVSLVGPHGVGKTRLARELARSWRAHCAFADVSGARDVDLLRLVIASELGVAPADVATASLPMLLADRLGGDGLLVLDGLCAPPGWLRDLVTSEGLRGAHVLVTTTAPAGLPGERTLLLDGLDAHDASSLLAHTAAVAEDRLGPVLALLPPHPTPRAMIAIGALIRAQGIDAAIAALAEPRSSRRDPATLAQHAWLEAAGADVVDLVVELALSPLGGSLGVPGDHRDPAALEPAREIEVLVSAGGGRLRVVEPLRSALAQAEGAQRRVRAWISRAAAAADPRDVFACLDVIDALRGSDPELAAQLALGLDPILRELALHDRRHRLLEDCAVALPPGASPRLEIGLRVWSADAAQLLGRGETERASLERARALLADADDPTLAADLAALEAMHALGKSDLAAARRHFAIAESAIARGGRPRLHAWLLGAPALVSIHEGRPAEAAVHLESVAASRRAEGDLRGESMALEHRALCLWHAGDLVSARRGVEAGAARARALGRPRGEAFCRLVGGFVELAADQPDRARDLFAQVAALARSLGHAPLSAEAARGLGIAEAMCGELERASAHLEDAARALGALRRTETGLALAALALVDHERGLPDLARARLESARQHPQLDDGRAVLARITAAIDGSSPPEGAARGAEDAIARRLIDRFVERQRRAGARRPIRTLPVLALDAHARSFALGGAPPVSLAKRALLWTVLGILATRRGEVVSDDALIAGTWPGERGSAHALRHRLQVAVSQLRKLGLGDALRRTEGGYVLDATVHHDDGSDAST